MHRVPEGGRIPAVGVLTNWWRSLTDEARVSWRSHPSGPIPDGMVGSTPPEHVVRRRGVSYPDPVLTAFVEDLDPRA